MQIKEQFPCCEHCDPEYCLGPHEANCLRCLQRLNLTHGDGGLTSIKPLLVPPCTQGCLLHSR